MLAYHRQSTEGEVYHIKEAAPLSKDREVELLRYVNMTSGDSAMI